MMDGEELHPTLELSVVIPCLNEAETLEVCLKKALKALGDGNIVGEVIVADNGSTDDSPAIATRCGARLIPVSQRGYGAALMGGIQAARGRFVIMADADDSYDFLEIPRFLKALRDGAEMAQGCRLPAGGGTVRPGAMPFLHRWLGNPLFSLLARHWFHAPIHDIYCGMRGFTRDLYERLNLRCTGMEFATEMIIKTCGLSARISEVPITLHPDGRRMARPHLKTFRDGWRTLSFFLMMSPKSLFWAPGLALVGLGVAGYGLAYGNVRIGPARFDVHTMLAASLALIMGYQSIQLALFTEIFASSEQLLPENTKISSWSRHWTMGKGLLAGIPIFVFGLLLLLRVTLNWRAQEYGPLDYHLTMRWVIPGVTLAALGFQTVLSGSFISVLGMRRK